MSETNRRIVYTGYYKDVFLEINEIYINREQANKYYRNNYDDWHYWTYYIFIDIEKIPKKYNPNSFWLPLETYKYGTRYKYDDHVTLSNIYFYSGITFYKKVSGLEEGEKKIIKVGCDFHHAWDIERGCFYSYDDIYAHVTKTINSLFDEIQGYGVES